MKKQKHFLSAIGLLALLVFSACDKSSKSPAPDNLSNKVILQWNEVTYEALGGSTNIHSLLTSRMYAMVHAAMHDAINATDPHFEAYAFHETHPGADPEVAAASAAHQVLKVTFPQRANYLDSVLNSFLATVPESPVKAAGITAGVKAGNTILSLGHNANGGENPIGAPAPAVKPGDYKLVPPFDFIFAPFWENSKMFSLQRKDQFRVSPPPALTSKEYADAFNEVKAVGSLSSTTRTTDQTFFAKYWYETSELGWNRIARIAVTDRKAGLFTTARLFALMNFAIADAYTAGWDSKLHYNFWRPFTAIREAAGDGNNATQEDVSWEPSEPTPPIQDYPSTHSALGNAGGTVLAYVLGDKTSFTMKSPSAVPAGAPRSFTRFSQAADENAESRIMAGIHFRFSCNAGQDLGNKIGNWTVEHYLKPLK